MADPISLKDYFEGLRREIRDAVLARPDKGVQFEVESMEIELTTQVERSKKRSLAFKVLSAEGSETRGHTQLLRLKIRPHIDDGTEEGKDVNLSGESDR